MARPLRVLWPPSVQPSAADQLPHLLNKGLGLKRANLAEHLIAVSAGRVINVDVEAELAKLDGGAGARSGLLSYETSASPDVACHRT